VKTNFKMKEATNKQEAIMSLKDVQKNKPELLTEYVRLSMFDIDKMSFQEVRDIYIQVKSRYYDTLDYSTKF
jgi:ribulose bisphosphate carboxylase small subunit